MFVLGTPRGRGPRLRRRGIRPVRHEWQWWSRHQVRDRGQLVGCGVRSGEEPGNHLGRARKDEPAANRGAHVVESEPEPRGDPKVATTTPNGPEQIRMVIGIGPHHLPVGGDDVRGEQVIDRQTVFAGQVTDTATERQPTDSHRAGIAEPGGKAVPAGGSGVLSRGQPGLCPCGPTIDVDIQCSQCGHVHHHAAVGCAMADRAVTATAYGQLRAGLPRE